MTELDGRKLRVQLSRSDEEVAELNEKRQAARDAKKAADKEAKQAAAAERAAAGETGGEVAGEGEAAKKPKKKSNKVSRVPIPYLTVGYHMTGAVLRFRLRFPLDRR